MGDRICLVPPATRLQPALPIAGLTTLLRPPFGQTLTWRGRNINRLPIVYDLRPRLRDRLTLSGLTFLRKP